MRALTLHIEGMSCGHCTQSVRGVLEKIPGVRIGSVEIGRAEMEYDEDRTDANQIASAVSEGGYPATQHQA